MKLFIFDVELEVDEWEPDPEAPGGGEMVRTGRKLKKRHEIRVVARHGEIAEAWIRVYFPECRYLTSSCMTVDAVIRDT